MVESTMLLEVYKVSDIIILTTMFLMLILAAIYDLNGAEVPDVVTMPYSILGVSASVLHGRYITAVLALAIVVFIMMPWRPKWMKKINSFFLHRAYAEGELAEHSEKLSLEANAFEERHGTTMLKLSFLLHGLALAAGIVIAFCLKEGESRERIGFLVCLAALTLIYGILASKQLKDVEGKGSEFLPEVEELSAMGGADIILFAGMLGVYGMIPFIYSMPVTLGAAILFAMVRRIFKNEKFLQGQPLIPSLLLTAPARVYITLVFCPGTIEAFDWFFGELLH